MIQRTVTTPSLTLDRLCAILGDLSREYPQAGPRLDHAAFIATFREVERGTIPSVWWVQSESDPNQTYMVTAGLLCCCQDFARRGKLVPCKHLLSVEIVQRAERIIAEQGDPTTQPIPYELTGFGDVTVKRADATICPVCSHAGVANHPDGLCLDCIGNELYGVA